MKQKYYSLGNILKEKADYNVIYGLRSNGKTFSVKDLILFGFHDKKLGIDINGYLDDGSQGAIIRRMEEDFRKGRGASMWADMVDNQIKGNMIEKASNGKWNNVKFYNMQWYLTKTENGKEVEIDDTPFCYAFALSSAEHYKSNSYPKINKTLLDEFIASVGYLINEFTLYTSILSTIIRDRDGVYNFLCGNSINKVNPYFTEMGLINCKNQKKNTIDVYRYGESDLRVAVEYTGTLQDDDKKPIKRKSDKYFAFDNPRLKMITTGDWELDIYPHLPYKYKPKDILFTYFIEFSGELLQAEVILVNDSMFTFIHRKTTEIKDPDRDFIYSPEYDPRPNWHRKITAPRSRIEKQIAEMYAKDKVFYADNEVGEIVRNYLVWCGKNV